MQLCCIPQYLQLWLLLKYGAKKLSEIDPASYKALVADAEVLGNV